MKTIGILFGQENQFPPALVERINSKGLKDVRAEFVRIEHVHQAEPADYAVIIDRISHDVPFYRAFLKNAALTGTAVVNNPFWWSADEKFFNNALAQSIGLTVPKTALLPSNHRPADTTEQSFRNMALPLAYDRIFEYVGFPAFMKPHAGGGWKHVYRVESAEELFARHNETGQLVMMLQEAIEYESYYRCYSIGGKHVRVMPYEPQNPFHERYLQDVIIEPTLLARLEKAVADINEYLGYDFNTVEIAVKGDELYLIDFCNPAPDADKFSVGEANFEWVLETAADFAIERAQAQNPDKLNLTWGKFVKNAARNVVLGQVKPFKAPAAKKKAAPRKKAAPKKAATE